jgi:hypothetical protein
MRKFGTIAPLSLLLIVLCLGVFPSLAAESLIGTWTVIEAKTGPWYDGSGAKPEVDPKLAHATFVFTANSATGPLPIGCGKAKFTTSVVGSDYLFEGGLKDPKKDAAGLGFKSDKITSVNEGCLKPDADMEMDIAFIDSDTAVFGLNNVVYKMKRATK